MSGSPETIIISVYDARGGRGPFDLAFSVEPPLLGYGGPSAGLFGLDAAGKHACRGGIRAYRQPSWYKQEQSGIVSSHFFGGDRPEALYHFSYAVETFERAALIGRFCEQDFSHIAETGNLVRFGADVFEGSLREYDVVMRNGERWKFILGYMSQNRRSREGDNVVFINAIVAGPHVAMMPFRHAVGGTLATARRHTKPPGGIPDDIDVTPRSRPAGILPDPTASSSPVLPAGSVIASTVAAPLPMAPKTPPKPESKRVTPDCSACRHLVRARRATPHIAPEVRVHGDSQTLSGIASSYDSSQKRFEEEFKLRVLMLANREAGYPNVPRYVEHCRIIDRGTATCSEPSIKNAARDCKDFAPHSTSKAECEQCRHYIRATGPDQQRRHIERMFRGDLNNLKSGASLGAQAMDTYGIELKIESTMANEMGYFDRAPRFHDACTGHPYIGPYVDPWVENVDGQCQQFRR